MVAINVSLGSGADQRASTGKIAIRPVEEHKSGNFLALSAWVEYALSSEPIEWNLPAGRYYQSREIVPSGKSRVFKVPEETTDYADLVWLTESGGPGIYVIEPDVTYYNGATGEPDVAVGDWWIATNPAHPYFGLLLEKDS